MELDFNSGLTKKPDKLTNTISIFSKSFMILNCDFNIGFENADNIIFTLKVNGKEINKIALKECKDRHFTISNMVNINKVITIEGTSVEIIVVEYGGPFELKLNYM